MTIPTLFFKNSETNKARNLKLGQMISLYIKHVLGEVDKSHFAVLSKSRLKFLICIWPCCQVRHIKLFTTENWLKIKTIFFLREISFSKEIKIYKKFIFWKMSFIKFCNNVLHLKFCISNFWGSTSRGLGQMQPELVIAKFIKWF